MNNIQIIPEKIFQVVNTNYSRFKHYKKMFKNYKNKNRKV